MELKSLILGMIFALGAFGIKCGAGLAYVIKGRQSWYAKGLALLSFMVAYLVIFEICFEVIKITDLLSYVGAVQEFLQYSMVIHLVIAGGLVFWAISLLKKHSSPSKGTRAWLAMVIPCPVCVAVIFLTTSFIMSFFPGKAHVAVLSGYLVFILVAFITATAMSLWSISQVGDRERQLGLVMITVAGYFILSILIMPQFKDIDKIYRLSGYSGSAGSLNLKQWIIMGSVAIMAFLSGFVWSRKSSKGIIK